MPPGFDRGLVFAEDGYTVLRDSKESQKKTSIKNYSNLTLRDVIGKDIELLGIFLLFVLLIF